MQQHWYELYYATSCKNFLAFRGILGIREHLSPCPGINHSTQNESTQTWASNITITNLLNPCRLIRPGREFGWCASQCQSYPILSLVTHPLPHSAFPQPNSIPFLPSAHPCTGHTCTGGLSEHQWHQKEGFDLSAGIPGHTVSKHFLVLLCQPMIVECVFHQYRPSL